MSFPLRWEKRVKLNSNRDVLKKVAHGQENSRHHKKNIMLLQVLPLNFAVQNLVLQTAMKEAFGEPWTTQDASYEVVAVDAETNV